MSGTWSLTPINDGTLFGIKGQHDESGRVIITFSREPEFATAEEAWAWGMRYIAAWERSKAASEAAVVQEPVAVTQSDIDQAIIDLEAEEALISNGMGGDVASDPEPEPEPSQLGDLGSHGGG